MRGAVGSDSGGLVRPLLPLLFLAGCLHEVGPGPDVGPCAAPPDGVYTFGQIGIGTCLAGPSGLSFFEGDDDRTWLAVSNANPALTFETGSVLLIDWDSIDLDRRVNRLHEVDAHALPLENFLGGVAHHRDPFKDVLLVTGRLSEGALTTSPDDRLFVVDVEDPTSPAPWALGDELELGADPGPVVVHDDADRAYVLNVTDRTVSVLDVSAAPIEAIDVAPRARVGPVRFFDVDASGSRADLAVQITEPRRVPNEQWDLTWVDGLWRLWAPSQGGLERWTHGGTTYHDPAWSLELDPEDYAILTEVTNPAHVRTPAPTLYFGDDGDILQAIQVTAGTWGFDTPGRVPWVAGGDPGAWDAWLDAPSVVPRPEEQLVYYDARPAPGEPAAIGLTVADGLDRLRSADPLLEPSGPWTSLEQPFVRLDELARRYRMWLSLWDGDQWRVGHAESEDGTTWSEPTVALDLGDLDVAAPVVTWSGGRYRMWVTVGDGSEWWVAESWSHDGLAWSEPTEAFPLDGPFDLTAPPRVAVDVATTGAFSIEGSHTPTDVLAAPGGWQSLGDYGLLLRPATGFHLTGDDLGPTAVNGLLPISTAEVDGEERLYVTAVDDANRRSIGVFRRTSTGWQALAQDLVPPGTGGNAAGVEAAVVVPTAEGAEMYYGARTEAGVTEIRRAVSDDGLSWAAADLDLPPAEPWEAIARLPHHVEPLDDGGVRLWYSGNDGGRFRIGALRSADGVTFEAEPLDLNPWQLGPGPSGTFDDEGVRDPVVHEIDGVLHLWYSAFDGERWSIAHATRAPDDPRWERTLSPLTDQAAPLLFGVPRSFSESGVRSPVLRQVGDDVELLYAGFDGSVHRVGEAIGGLDRLFPAQRFPTPFDRLSFSTRRGVPGTGAISLQQQIAGQGFSGIGASGIRLDEERGLLYAVSGVSAAPANYIYVIDVDDSADEPGRGSTFLDVRAILEVGQTIYSSGFRDVLPIPGTDLLYASGQDPDSVVVFDLSRLEGHRGKTVIRDAAVAALPLLRIPSDGPERPLQEEDAGAPTREPISGAGMAVSPDGRTLLVAQFRENAVLAFDLSLGAYGEEVRRIADVGENPHRIELSPDGRYAVVANYLGDVRDNVPSSTLAVIDLDRDSPTFLEVVTWLRNR